MRRGFISAPPFLPPGGLRMPGPPPVMPPMPARMPLPPSAPQQNASPVQQGVPAAQYAPSLAPEGVLMGQQGLPVSQPGMPMAPPQLGTAPPDMWQGQMAPEPAPETTGQSAQMNDPAQQYRWMQQQAFANQQTMAQQALQFQQQQQQAALAAMLPFLVGQSATPQTGPQQEASVTPEPAALRPQARHGLAVPRRTSLNSAYSTRGNSPGYSVRG